MSNITSISEIRNAIVLLETEQEVKGQLLRQQAQLTYESLKPVNLLKSAVQDMTSAPLPTKLLGTTAGMALAYLARKIVIGASVNIFGSMIQLGVTKLIARQSTRIKSISRFVNKSLFSRGQIDAGKQ